MKQSPLHSIHVNLNAKMVPFGGYLMPIEYSGIKKEHLAVREKAGIFDVSHMGEVWVKGKQAKAYLQRLTVNNVDLLKPGKAQYTCLPNGKGGIVDDLLIYHYEENKYMLVINASNHEKDWNWLNQHNQEGVVLEDASDHMALIAVQGPNAESILKKIIPHNELKSIGSFEFIVREVIGCNNVIISKTGYTGEPGYELYMNHEAAPEIWKQIMDAGKDKGLVPVGLGARDTLRLEAGLCLYGNDIDDQTSPMEAAIRWTVKFDKDFIDRDYLYQQYKEGIKQKLVGFELTEKGIPRKDYPIQDQAGNTIGRVTSGTYSPYLNKPIGMGYVDIEFSKPGSDIFIGIRKKSVPAKVVKIPFYIDKQ